MTIIKQTIISIIIFFNFLTLLTLIILYRELQNFNKIIENKNIEIEEFQSNLKSLQMDLLNLKEEKNKEVNKYKSKLELKRKELQSKCKEYADFTQKSILNEKVKKNFISFISFIIRV